MKEKTDKQLEWKFFGQYTSETNEKDTRNLFNGLVRVVKQIIGSDIVSQEELGASLYIIYHVMTNQEKTDNQKSAFLKKYFRAMTINQFSRAQEICVKLGEFVSENIADEGEKEKLTDKQISESPKCVFGDDLKFEYSQIGFLEDSMLEPEAPANAFPVADPLSPAAQAIQVASSIPVDHEWLEDRCHEYVLRVRSCPFSPEDLSRQLLEFLGSSRDTISLQNDLMNLLGLDAFDFISMIIQRRYLIVKARVDVLASLEAQTTSSSSAFSIKTRQEINLEKQHQKELKKLRSQLGKMVSQDAWIKEMGLDKHQIKQIRETQLSGPDMSLQIGIDRSEENQSQGLVLPPDAIQRDEKIYKEIIFPAKENPEVNQDDLVPISEFEEFAQLAFKGYTHLNPLQSKVFESAYRKNTNLLICAPTGAGKTNIAMMTMLREIGQHFKQGVLHKEDFKVVYVAPMKALAAEMTAGFSKRLRPLGVVVKELTGDMQLTRAELEETQVIVTTPEKWDVITRKSTDVALTQLVRLLIIDEVHLLNEDRGHVIESLVARTLRQVEQSQSMIRIVGLSATLPNYKDVAMFLRVDPDVGLFFADRRPVPLETHYIGVKGKNVVQQKAQMTEVCFEKALKSVRAGYQIMIFVHSRKDTVNTAKALIDLAHDKGLPSPFAVDPTIINSQPYFNAQREVTKSRNRELKEIFQHGFGMHNAGMLRNDRNLVEDMFMKGYINVLVTTATLAWGVNLPAHTVIIKGTEVYNTDKGGFCDLGVLDVLQIFGRAGRPQFDTSGEAMIITSAEKMPHYIKLLANQVPIESKFIDRLADHLNAEIVLGTVASMKDAIIWLSYTYLYIRMLKNPLVYGCTIHDKELDPLLYKKRTELIVAAAKQLDKCRMIRFEERAGNFSVTELGRIASHYYIQYETIELFNSRLNANLTDALILDVVASAGEFQNVMVRDDEQEELRNLEEICPLKIRGGAESKEGKTNILLQSFIGGTQMNSFSLISDMSYVSSNAGRIFRAIFEISRSNGWVQVATKLLNLCKMVDKRMWSSSHPLEQFGLLKPLLIHKLSERKMSVDAIREASIPDLVGITRSNPQTAKAIKAAANYFPRLEIEASMSPITRTVIRVTLTITCDFKWLDKIHGQSEPWWIWVEDEHDDLVHAEYFILSKKQKDEEIKITFIIPIYADPFPEQYYVVAFSDRWLNAETTIPLCFRDIILPDQQPPHTQLLALQPLPLQALKNPEFEKLYRFTHFNRVQTQAFWTMYHTDSNALVGAPTGSGKTIVAELAMLKLFRDTNLKVVYIGPLKALVRERLKDWKRRFAGMLGKKVIELTGDYTPDIRSLQTADIILTTPEKWDGISRNWQQRSYVKKVGLMVIDEIHLLGEDRGPILEVIVSRMRYVASQTDTPIRFVGLSTALANPEDLGDWLGIEPPLGLYNFHPSNRPVPIRIHLQGYAGKHYCPRMATMNKPAYAAINTHSPTKPVLIFVSSRRQTRLTALDLITYCVADESPKQFLCMPEEEIEQIIDEIEDPNLKHTLAFGIGLHHAGLKNEDRAIVESLFEQCKIQVLVSTSTLAWGVNLPAHLVIIKGTEFYDAKTKRYVDFPVTDVLQMMGRAGRPQYDTEGVAVVMVEQSKKSFYKKFIREPFPVESSLKDALHDHINAEICSGTISSKQDAVDYLTWTYFFRRLEQNPTYYGLSDVSFESINQYLSDLTDDTLRSLAYSHCIEFDEEDENSFEPTTLGRIASYYYLHYTTVELFHSRLNESCSVEDLLNILADAAEYEELPVRHNEDVYNKALSEQVSWQVDEYSYDSPHTKANLLLQAHFSHIKFWVPDYWTDLKSVLDQAIRILQAMVDSSADGGWLWTTLNTIELVQMIMQGCWSTDSSLSQLPCITPKILDMFHRRKITCLPQLLSMKKADLRGMMEGIIPRQERDLFWRVVECMPLIDVEAKMEEVVATGDECALNVSLSRASKYSESGAYVPQFPKKKEEGWWLILGDPNTGELIALRRVNGKGKSETQLLFDAPLEPGHYHYYLYFLCDCYIGLDQQFDIKFEVIAGEGYGYEEEYEEEEGEQEGEEDEW
eukprot:TRINITY_DN2045_c0_g2_i1.p1 TRINITY_DN2045_c0_g2~~TRINITY_DN2045_c0_g2_i1.p1  ORF type:complete len:2126 (-),score=516.29 TRINITY_DN2045_c0_g2_i1:21-6239(-)